ncbi:MAG TPA: hypothetical protein VKB24_00790, partial [Candidatus Acidoferrum sp.]|nr:hypothetical protein [Candidatus Acidoferrum sp.]
MVAVFLRRAAAATISILELQTYRGITFEGRSKTARKGSARGAVKIRRPNYFLRASVMVLLERLPSWRLV